MTPEFFKGLPVTRPITMFSNDIGGYCPTSITHQPLRHLIPEIGYCANIFGPERCYNPLDYLFQLLGKIKKLSSDVALFAVGFKGLGLGGLAGWDLGLGIDMGWNLPTNDADLVIASNLSLDNTVRLASDLGRQVSDTDMQKFGGHEDFRRIYVDRRTSVWPEISEYVVYQSQYWPRMGRPSTRYNHMEIHFLPYAPSESLITRITSHYQPFYCTWGTSLYTALPRPKTQSESAQPASPYPFSDYPKSPLTLDEYLVHPFPLDFNQPPQLKLTDPGSWLTSPRNPTVLIPRIALASLIFSYNFQCPVTIAPEDLETMRTSLTLFNPHEYPVHFRDRLEKTLAHAEKLDALANNPYMAGDRLHLWPTTAVNQILTTLTSIGYPR